MIDNGGTRTEVKKGRFKGYANTGELASILTGACGVISLLCGLWIRDLYFMFFGAVFMVTSDISSIKYELERLKEYVKSK